MKSVVDRIRGQSKKSPKSDMTGIPSNIDRQLALLEARVGNLRLNQVSKRKILARVLKVLKIDMNRLPTYVSQLRSLMK